VGLEKDFTEYVMTYPSQRYCLYTLKKVMKSSVFRTARFTPSALRKKQEVPLPRQNDLWIEEWKI